MVDLIEVMLPPFAACIVLAGLFSYLGIHVIAREVIFVDLALAQMAALGSTTATLFHVSPDSTLGYACSFAFTTLAALIFSLTHVRREKRRVPQEAFIGITFVMASAAAVLVASRSPAGHEVIEEVLVGSILWVNWRIVLRLLVVFAAVGLFHWFLRNRFLTISLREREAERRGWHIRWWDFLFYLSFGVAITAAVPVAGVLLVFTFLVVPAVVAFLFSRNAGVLVGISWAVGALASAVGLYLSFQLDMPTGPLVVCVFGIALVVAVAISTRFPVPEAESASS
jgi:zinc/manganese transport system permease protein